MDKSDQTQYSVIGINNNDGNKQKNCPKPKGFGKRHLQAVLSFLAFTTSFALRANMSVAIVAMVDNSNNVDYPQYDWDESTRGLILSSMYWGMVISPFPSAILAKQYGPKYPLLVALVVASILAVLTPFTAPLGWQYVCASGFVQGLGHGFGFPCLHTLMAKWIHPVEREIVSVVFSGTTCGSIIMLATSGVIASSSLGWPGIFYLSGGCCMVWAVFWTIFCKNSAAEYETISAEELEFIESIPGSSAHSLSTPWMEMMKSKPFWSLIVAQFAQMWGFVTLLSEIPSYIDGVLHFNIKSNALLSSIPYVAMLIMTAIFYRLSDYLIQTKRIYVGTVRKVFNTVGMGVPMICLFILGNIDNNIYSAIILLALGIGLNAAIQFGYMISHMDISPNFAGTIMGVCQSSGNIMSILGPTFVGYIVTDRNNPALWNIVFSVTGSIYLIGGLAFVLFGSGKVQKWNNVGVVPVAEPMLLRSM